MERLTLTLLGHKDHGKSTLIGRLLHDTGSVKADRLDEVRTACHAAGRPFDFSFLVDSFQEERRDGMTMDIIHAQITGKRYQYDVVDVPGHKELIRNMLTGASRADAGLLIVSALEGVEEQTGQHVRLARWLGLDRLVVAVNKMDAVGYSEAVFDRVVGRLEEVTGGRVGTVVPISALTGEQVVARAPTLAWHEGPTLIEALDVLEREPPATEGPLRIPIQDAYAGPGGRWVVGRIESGTARVGRTVVFTPSGARRRIVELLILNRPADHAGPGENVGLRLDDDRTDLQRGEVACAEDAILAPRSDVAVDAIFVAPPPEHAVAECGPSSTPCRIERSKDAPVGDVISIVLRCERPLVVEAGRTALGRMALKDGRRVVGAATVRRGRPL